MKEPRQDAKGYKSTLNLPRTAFGMKADLARKEPVLIERWEKEGLYQAIRESRAGSPPYTLHDGPPYPTGDLHIGTGMNKILKDFVIRYRNMAGFDAPFVPGWDCHGLPIEHKVMTELGEKAADMTEAEIRGLCLKFALRFVEANRRQFRSLGCLGRWEDPYLTIKPAYEAGVLRVFGKLVEKGYVFRQLKPIHWCRSCRTALAEAELEYGERSDYSVFVEFPFLEDSGRRLAAAAGLEDSLSSSLSILIWTTTPWTLPANRAVAVSPSYEYALLRAVRPEGGQERLLVVAKDAVSRLAEETGLNLSPAVAAVSGRELLGLEYRHPLSGRGCPVIEAGYVTLEDGTGCVHTAPGHGSEDYASGVRHGLEVFSPVDAAGRFTEQVGDLAGLEVFEANPVICQRLRDAGLLWAEGRISHSYPHCWRCHSPVIFRATQQWFVSLSHRDLRARVLEEASRVSWIPDWGYNRIRGMLEQRPDWCISRQRNWGVPIPAFYCTSCGEALLSGEVIEKVAELFAAEGADSWFTRSVAELLPPGTACPACGGTDFRKENDIFDVWFESGSSHRSVVMQEEGLRFPADLYLEGSDQHRGWFQLSLLLATAAEDRAPYRSVLTHGFVVDGKGEKMSKSRGNFISVTEALKKFPADILRLWFASVDYRRDIHVSFDLMGQIADAYRKIRNTFRHVLGNLNDFTPEADLLPLEKMEEIDRWILASVSRLSESVAGAYENFEFHRVYRDIHNFCVVQMSSIYLDVCKDRLYTWPASSSRRRSCQSALWRIAVVLAKFLAPIIPFTTEEIWGELSGKLGVEGQTSIHLSRWPREAADWRDDGLLSRWERLLGVREEVLKALEASRAAGEIGTSLAAQVVLEGGEGLAGLLEDYRETLPELFIVSSVRLLPGNGPLRVRIEPAPGKKCERCWKYSPSVGEDAEHPIICGECRSNIEQQERT